MKQLLASQEVLHPRLFSSLQSAIHPILSISKTGVNIKKIIAEALKNEVPHPNGVRQVLERRREQSDRLPPLTLTLPDNDKARNIVVRAPSLAAYDQIDADANADADADADADAENDTEQTDDNNN